MKILFITHKFFPDVGGIESHSEILARYLAYKGHEILLVTQSCGDPSDDLIRFPFSVLRRPTIAQLLKSYLGVDIVFQNNIELRSLWPCFLIFKPLVISIHTWIRGSSGERRFVDLLKLCALRLAKRVISVSDAIRKDSLNNSNVIPNPYNNECFKVLPAANRNYAIVFLGRFVSDKGCDLLLEAFSKIRLDRKVVKACQNQGIDLRLTLIGSGPEEAYLRSIVKAKRLNFCVSFVGIQTGIVLVELLNRHQILVIPSRWCEPFGMVALEGMACGCVVVGSDGGGLPDAIGLAGLTFERGNSDALAEQLKMVLTQPQIRVELRSKSALHLKSHHIKNICARYKSIIDQLVKVQ